MGITTISIASHCLLCVLGSSRSSRTPHDAAVRPSGTALIVMAKWIDVPAAASELGDVVASQVDPPLPDVPLHNSNEDPPPRLPRITPELLRQIKLFGVAGKNDGVTLKLDARTFVAVTNWPTTKSKMKDAKSANAENDREFYRHIPDSTVVLVRVTTRKPPRLSMDKTEIYLESSDVWQQADSLIDVKIVNDECIGFDLTPKGHELVYNLNV